MLPLNKCINSTKRFSPDEYVCLVDDAIDKFMYLSMSLFKWLEVQLESGMGWDLLVVPAL